MIEARIEFLFFLHCHPIEHQGAGFVAEYPQLPLAFASRLISNDGGVGNVVAGGFSCEITGFVDPNRALTYTKGSVSLAGFPLGSAL